MVCCALLSTFIAAALWLSRQFLPNAVRSQRDALAWRLDGRSFVDDSRRATPDRFRLSARMKSMGFAVDGLRFMLRNEHNAQIHLAASIAIVLAGIVIGIKPTDWRWIAVAVSWVWFAEAMNTAFEHLCDVVCQEPNDNVGIAKDVAAGAVLVSAIGAVVLGALTLLPYVMPSATEFGADFFICRSGP